MSPIDSGPLERSRRSEVFQFAHQQRRAPYSGSTREIDDADAGALDAVTAELWKIYEARGAGRKGSCEITTKHI